MPNTACRKRTGVGGYRTYNYYDKDVSDANSDSEEQISQSNLPSNETSLAFEDRIEQSEESAKQIQSKQQPQQFTSTNTVMAQFNQEKAVENQSTRQSTGSSAMVIPVVVRKEQQQARQPVAKSLPAPIVAQHQVAPPSYFFPHQQPLEQHYQYPQQQPIQQHHFYPVAQQPQQPLLPKYLAAQNTTPLPPVNQSLQGPLFSIPAFAGGNRGQNNSEDNAEGWLVEEYDVSYALLSGIFVLIILVATAVTDALTGKYLRSLVVAILAGAISSGIWAVKSEEVVLNTRVIFIKLTVAAFFVSSFLEIWFLADLWKTSSNVNLLSDYLSRMAIWMEADGETGERKLVRNLIKGFILEYPQTPRFIVIVLTSLFVVLVSLAMSSWLPCLNSDVVLVEGKEEGGVCEVIGYLIPDRSNLVNDGNASLNTALELIRAAILERARRASSDTQWSQKNSPVVSTSCKSVIYTSPASTAATANSPQVSDSKK